MITKRIAALGEVGLEWIRQYGKTGILLYQMLFFIPNIRKHGLRLIARQMYDEGVRSLSIVIVSGLFIGMVLALQGHHTLSKFGASMELGPLVALSVLRELGPVVTAILFAGRAGTALAAEIGLMQATAQMSSMEMMAVDPVRRILSPRFWGGFISLPLLTLIFNAIAIYGAWLVGVQWLGFDSGTFWSNMQSSVDFHLDVINGIIKSIVFGFVVTVIAVFQGNFCIPTSAGIANATTRTIVYSSLAVLGIDFILTAMMIGGW